MIDSLIKNGKCLLLAYDQGFEHGPVDFDDYSVDPSHIVQLLKDTNVFTGIIFHEGIVEKYYPIDEQSVPLIVKLNGKTAFAKTQEPISLQMTSVKEAIRIGAKAVGYTIYTGSEQESIMMREFSAIEDEAHAAGLGVILWMYPRGKAVRGKENTKETLAYAARLALELNADMVKLPYSGDTESFRWVVQAAGKTKVVVQGGIKTTEEDFLHEMSDSLEAGAIGCAVGRNIWQAKNPVQIAQKLGDLVYGTK